MEPRPPDYIDLSTVRVKRTLKVAPEINRLIPRFYDQEFTAAHVYELLKQNKSVPFGENPALNTTVRSHLAKLGRTGVIDIVSHGSKGSGNFSIYRNKP